MEGSAYKCPNCSASIPAKYIDFKAREGFCPFCESQVSFRRSTFNQADNVLNNINNAVRFFIDKNMQTAYHYAEEVLSVAVDNLAALFIMAYYHAYSAPVKKFDYLNRLFNEQIGEIEVDAMECESFKKLVLAVRMNLGEFEDKILSLVLETQTPKDVQLFTEDFSPYLINSRLGMRDFTPELFSVYEKITEQVDVPKTWYALYMGIRKNPDSPFNGNMFHLEKKVQNFYNIYVLNVGKVFDKIQTVPLKTKFLGAYKQDKALMESKMKS